MVLSSFCRSMSTGAIRCAARVLEHADHRAAHRVGLDLRHDRAMVRPLAARHLDHGPERVGRQHAEEDLDHFPVQMPPGGFTHRLPDDVRGHTAAMGAIGGARVVEVGDRRDLSERRDASGQVHLRAPDRAIATRESARVAAAVLPFVMLVGDVRRHQAGLQGVADEEIAEARVVLHPPELLVAQHGGLVEDVGVHEDAADVVQDAAHRELVQQLLVVAEEAPDHGRRHRHVERVVVHVRAMRAERAEAR